MPTSGRARCVDGFANGWRIEPSSASFVVSLRFAPQRRVTIALWASLAAALLALALAIRTPASSRRGEGGLATSDAGAGLPEALRLTSIDTTGPPLTLPVTAVLAVAMALLGAVLATPLVGLLVGVLTAVASRGVLPRWATAMAAPVAMAASAGYVLLTVLRHHTLPGLEWASELHRAHPIAWLAVLALAVDTVVVALRGRGRR